MPFKGPEDPDLPPNVKALDTSERSKWVQVWNKTFANCTSFGGAEAACDRVAFRFANGTIEQIKMALATETLEAVEVLRVGTWNDRKYSRVDLDHIVEAYEATRKIFDAPVKLGHDDHQKLLQEDGYPAAGWVENIRRAGERLIADLVDVPAKLAEIIRAGGYRKRSVELRQKFNVAGREWPLMLTGIALLGADLPAVEGLGDIKALYQRLQLDLEDDTEIMVFELEMDLNDIIGQLNALHTQAEKLVKNRRGALVIKQLMRAYTEGLRRAVSLRNSKEDDMAMDEKALRKLLGLDDDADIADAVKALRTELELDDDASILETVKALKASKDKGDTNDKGDAAEREKMTKELKDSRERLILLELENTRKEATAQVDGYIHEARLLPKQREVAIKMALTGADDFKQFVESQPEGLLQLGERGSAGGEADVASLEPSELELQVGMVADSTDRETARITLIRSKAADKGVALPMGFGQPEKKD